MVNIQFRPNLAAIRTFCETNIQAHITRVLNKPDKTFNLTVGSITYKLRYEVNENNQVQVFVITNNKSVDISSPKLQLNLGAFLLPEALDLGIPARGYNSAAENTYTRDVMDSGLSDAELQAIQQKIQKIGLLQLIS